MATIFPRGSKLYAKIKGVDGTWKQLATGFSVDEREAAERWAADQERKVARARATASADSPTGPLTVRRWAKLWRDEREKLGKDAKHEYARLEHHVLPIIGDELLERVQTSHAVEVITHLRSTRSKETGKPLSPRTVHNVYGVMSLMFSDAVFAGRMQHAPTDRKLAERYLPAKIDADPEWRESALFSREEVETLISSSKIPRDRRVTYAIELLAGARPGEVSALRWKHYNAEKRPLGELTIAKSYNAKLSREKGTKTDAVKHVPVHATLAMILDGWREQGWAEMNGREPTPDDLIVPLPPADAQARTIKDGEPFRTDYYSRRRWIEDDLPALGWRRRRHYDTRATFITLALEDGANRAIIRERVTHTKPRRDAFDGYNRGEQWAATCAEVSKLRVSIARDPEDNVIEFPATARKHDADSLDLGAALVHSEKILAMSSTSGLRVRRSLRTLSVNGFGTDSDVRTDPRGLSHCDSENLRRERWDRFADSLCPIVSPSPRGRVPSGHVERKRGVPAPDWTVAGKRA